ncbi:TetR/AcrR family transcriptional regulator [Nioella sp.]|uniref:TetR/AcrR family transcriptional regulator n=1 Tax=Nioella sp. TaxID=1912091 RepID=UPI003B519EC2
MKGALVVISLPGILGGMGGKRSDTRQAILEAAYALFFRRGFARVSVDAIAEKAGVTKRTVYFHFTSKDDITAAALEVQHLSLMAQYRSWMRPDAGTVQAFLAHLFDSLRNWAERPGWVGSGYSRISVELADMRGHPARKAAHRHKAEVERWLCEQLQGFGSQEPARLAQQVLIQIEGGMGLALIHGDPSYLIAARDAALRLAEGDAA